MSGYGTSGFDDCPKCKQAPGFDVISPGYGADTEPQEAFDWLGTRCGRVDARKVAIDDDMVTTEAQWSLALPESLAADPDGLVLGGIRISVEYDTRFRLFVFWQRWDEVSTPLDPQDVNLSVYDCLWHDDPETTGPEPTLLGTRNSAQIPIDYTTYFGLRPANPPTVAVSFFPAPVLYPDEPIAAYGGSKVGLGNQPPTGAPSADSVRVDQHYVLDIPTDTLTFATSANDLAKCPVAEVGVPSRPSGTAQGRVLLAAVGFLTEDGLYDGSYSTWVGYMAQEEPKPVFLAFDDPESACGVEISSQAWAERFRTVFSNQFRDIYPTAVSGRFVCGGVTDNVVGSTLVDAAFSLTTPVLTDGIGQTGVSGVAEVPVFVGGYDGVAVTWEMELDTGSAGSIDPPSRAGGVTTFPQAALTDMRLTSLRVATDARSSPGDGLDAVKVYVGGSSYTLPTPYDTLTATTAAPSDGSFAGQLYFYPHQVLLPTNETERGLGRHFLWGVTAIIESGGQSPQVRRHWMVTYMESDGTEIWRKAFTDEANGDSSVAPEDIPNTYDTQLKPLIQCTESYVYVPTIAGLTNNGLLPFVDQGTNWRVSYPGGRAEFLQHWFRESGSPTAGPAFSEQQWTTYRPPSATEVPWQTGQRGPYVGVWGVVPWRDQFSTTEDSSPVLIDELGDDWYQNGS